MVISRTGRGRDSLSGLSVRAETGVNCFHHVLNSMKLASHVISQNCTRYDCGFHGYRRMGLNALTDFTSEFAELEGAGE